LGAAMLKILGMCSTEAHSLKVHPLHLLNMSKTGMVKIPGRHFNTGKYAGIKCLVLCQKLVEGIQKTVLMFTFKVKLFRTLPVLHLNILGAAMLKTLGMCSIEAHSLKMHPLHLLNMSKTGMLKIPGTDIIKEERSKSKFG